MGNKTWKECGNCLRREKVANSKTICNNCGEKYLYKILTNFKTFYEGDK